MRMLTPSRPAMIGMLLCLTFAQYGVATASSGLGYHWWTTAPPSARIDAVNESINSFETGWVFGTSNAFGVAERVITDGTSLGAVAQALPQMDPPHFSKSTPRYVQLVDNAYRGDPKQRAKPLAIIVMCLADIPPTGCHSKN